MFPRPGETGSSANHLLGAVASQFKERLVGKDDWIVRLSRVADHHRHTSALYRDSGQFVAVSEPLGGGGGRAVAVKGG